MGNNYIFKNISGIKAISTNHGIGLKKVLAIETECKSGLTQVAYGFLKAGEKVEKHVHPTMEEFYYFESGKSIFNIRDNVLNCKKGDFVMVPAGVLHFIEAITDTTFIYWGTRTK